VATTHARQHEVIKKLPKTRYISWSQTRATRKVKNNEDIFSFIILLFRTHNYDDIFMFIDPIKAHWSHGENQEKF